MPISTRYSWWRTLTSLSTTNVLLAVYATALAVATFIEHRTDTAMARMLVYNGYWFYLLQVLLVVNFVGVVVNGGYRKQKKWGMIVFHGAFLFILLGASITRMFGFEGTLHIREGETVSRMVSQRSFLDYRIIAGSDSLHETVPLSTRPLIGRGYEKEHRIGGRTVSVKQTGGLKDGRIRLQISVGDRVQDVLLDHVPNVVAPPTHLMVDDLLFELRFGPQYLPLPFSAELVDFRLLRYPGSHSPSSYESDLIITVDGRKRKEHVAMNRILSESGYRVYQSSYDPDEKGSVFTVNHDAAGTAVTYFGYWLLAVGILLILFGRRSRFARLRRTLKTLSSSPVRIVTILLLGGTLGASATPEAATRRNLNRYVPDVAQADSFARLQVQSSGGRIEPMGTHTRKILRKLYRSDSFGGFTADQVVLGLITYPQYWNMVKFIRQTNPELNRLIGNYDGKYVSFYDLFDAKGNYKLARQVDQIYNKPVRERTKLDKDILKLDEKINIVYALQEGRLLPVFPLATDPTHKWYSSGDDLSAFADKDSMFVSKIMDWYVSELAQAGESGEWRHAGEVRNMMATYQNARANIPLMSETKVTLELLYNRLALFSRSAFGYMAVGLLLLICTVLQLVYRRLRLQPVVMVLKGLSLLLFLLLTGGIALRWYISGQAPWSNAYESMVHVGWAAALAGLLFARRSQITLALASFLAGSILFVANLNFMDPEITPLVPVLKSYWLMIHVASITASYGFFGMSFLLGLLSLVLMLFRRPRWIGWERQLKEIRIINELSLIIGLCLLTAGTFMGAVWANESWGRYWGWDPKETWALVTMIVYAIVLHARFVPALRSDYAFSAMSVFGLFSVLMTFFGVNYYLSGLHSYGKSDTPPALGAVYLVFGLLVLLTVWVGWKRKKNASSTGKGAVLPPPEPKE